MFQPQWPAARSFPFEPLPQLRPLAKAWQHSRHMIAGICDALNNDSVPEEAACVAVSGSLNRMEAHDASDLDIIVVVDDSRSDLSERKVERVYDRIWKSLTTAVSEGQLKRPKPGGIFSTVARFSALTSPDRRGLVDEDLVSYGQRMQLLMDSQPVHGQAGFADLQAKLLQWYSETRVQAAFGEAGPFHWFWQDIQRYWRSIRSRACWLHADELRKSLEVNLKLRSSRLAIVTAMLWAIECSHAETSTDDMLTKLLHLLRQTPLERLTQAVGEGDEPRLLASYQAVWKYTAELSPDTVKPSGDVLLAIDEFRSVLHPVTRRNSDWVF